MNKMKETICRGESRNLTFYDLHSSTSRRRHYQLNTLERREWGGCEAEGKPGTVTPECEERGFTEKVTGVSAHMRIWVVIFFQASLLICGVIFLPKTMKFSCLNADSGESRQVASARARSPSTMRLEKRNIH